MPANKNIRKVYTVDRHTILVIMISCMALSFSLIFNGKAIPWVFCNIKWTWKIWRWLENETCGWEISDNDTILAPLKMFWSKLNATLRSWKSCVCGRLTRERQGWEGEEFLALFAQQCMYYLLAFFGSYCYFIFQPPRRTNGLFSLK